MEDLDIPIPLPQKNTLEKLRVGIVFNLKKGVKTGAPDIEAEYDNIETVHAIKEALSGDTLEVSMIEADGDLAGKLRKDPVDIVFNIAEGIAGRGREAQVPALLNMLGIPFTGSDETTLCIALDKALTKRLLSTYHVKTPKYGVIRGNAALSSRGLRFPVIVKPNAEGSSKGISDVSIVKNAKELKELAQSNIKTYGQDMLAEEYIDGRELTVGILGNGDDVRIFPPMEIVYLKNTQENYRVYSYNVKQNYKKFVRYDCPAHIDEKTLAKVTETAKKIYSALSCRDFSRMDFRLAPDGALYFIEINPLPGLAPGYSDYPMLAEFSGTGYKTLIRQILNAALKRHNIAYTCEVK